MFLLFNSQPLALVLYFGFAPTKVFSLPRLKVQITLFLKIWSMPLANTPILQLPFKYYICILFSSAIYQSVPFNI